MPISRRTAYTANTIIEPDVHNLEHDDYVAGINQNTTDIANLNVQVDIKDANTAALYRGFVGGAPPVYVSAGTFTVAHFNVRNSTNDGNITKTTSTTVNTAASGLNGISQSANLAGSVSTSAGSATITGVGTAFLTDFIVGDVISIPAIPANARITAIASDTSLTIASTIGTATSNNTYRRGAVANNTWYNLYAIGDGVTPGLILSTRNVAGGNTLVDLPTGYTKSRQLPFAIRLDSSANILPFAVQGWPYAVYVAWRDYQAGGTAPYRVLSSGSATTFTAVSCKDVVPPISRMFHAFTYTAYAINAIDAHIRPTGSGLSIGRVYATVTASATVAAHGLEHVLTDANQNFDYKITNTGPNTSIDVMGWYVTEVF